MSAYTVDLIDLEKKTVVSTWRGVAPDRGAALRRAINRSHNIPTEYKPILIEATDCATPPHHGEMPTRYGFSITEADIKAF